jgi:hypothetical protein
MKGKNLQKQPESRTMKGKRRLHLLQKQPKSRPMKGKRRVHLLQAERKMILLSNVMIK